ncbi:protein ARV1-like [Haliotis rubra]|uniref:protein ARV1-like n=1 Tax=Haliotis rubra TaxID=36100 RepID=UPI001EE5B12A|nr:protein ARV1-like [Haliotis rubra]XP_046571184.1 protein ARV1-like [Haliotis rubra]
MNKFQCISCGKPADELYRDFKGGIIKISHCSSCDEVVDKYIEYEPVIIYLDALLLKLPAFRHILINTVQTAIWKFTLVILLCEAFIRLLQDRYAKVPMAGPIKPDYVFYSALEWNLYYNYAVSAGELMIFLMAVVTVLFILQRKRGGGPQHPQLNIQLVVRALIWSNFGKVLVIPVMLWGQTYSAIYLSLSRAYVLACYVQALRVTGPASSLLEAVTVISIGSAVQWGVMACLPT